MGAFLFILFVVILVIIIINNFSSGGAQQNQRTHASYPPPKIDIPVRLTVSFGTGSTNDNDIVKGPRANPDDLWVPSGQSVTIHNYQIQGGLIYVGKDLATENGYYLEPSLIIPELPIDSINPDRIGSSVSYWPSYSRISPQARAAYLEWLSQGRRTPCTNIGYIFIFFYGLERRLLLDIKTSQKAQLEASIIINEVEALLEVYGGSSSFKSYATKFIEYIKIIFFPDNINVDPSRLVQFGDSLKLKLTLAWFAEKAKPIPSDWALTWAGIPDYRGKDKFRELFAIRYREKYGEGLIVESNATKILIEYRPASNSMVGSPLKREINKSDIMTQTAPFRNICEIRNGCINELNPYIWFVGRRPEYAKSITALALLPEALLLTSKNKIIARLRKYLESITNENSNPVLVKSQELLGFFEYTGLEKLTKAELVTIAQILGKFSFAIIPDIRFEEGRVDPETFVVIFKTKSQSQLVSSKAYNVSLMLMKLAVAISVADNDISVNERLVLESQIERTLDLSEYEKERLKACLFWLCRSQPELNGLKRKLSALDISQRESVAGFILHVANADGIIQTDEIKALKKIYKLLSLNPENIYSDIHKYQTSDTDELVTILPMEQGGTGYVLPKRRSDENKVDLDEGRIQKTLKDTEKVQIILAEVFEDDEIMETTIMPKNDTIIGLDSSHSKLLTLLLEKSKWDHKEYEETCKKCDVLPEGAIETINSRSYEIFNDALIEEGEGYEINTSLAKEIKH